jgi:two-component system, chemotaxis family, response regulator Rcp1
MASFRTIRLLVVEDNAAYLHLVQLAFNQRGANTRWELMIANDGEEALRLLFQEEQQSKPLPDLVLLDWNLPKVTGNEVLKRMKEHQTLRRIPVLIFSTSEADTDIHAAYDNHANGYITKPDGIDALAAVVETIEQFWTAVARIPKVARSAGGGPHGK